MKSITLQLPHILRQIHHIGESSTSPVVH
jgi:hypothetical protein